MTDVLGAGRAQKGETTGRPGMVGWPAFAGDALFGAGVVALLAWAAYCQRGVWFFIDEWVIITRYHDGHWLQPFNGHLSLVPVVIYRGLLSTVGYHFVWYRIVGLLCYSAVVVTVFLFARRRVLPIAAALAALMVAWSSQGRLMIMFPLLLNFSAPIAAVVAIWLLLDRDRTGADIVGSVLMAVALATSAVGLLAPVTVVSDLVLRRKRRVVRWLIFLPPVALWSIWYAVDGLGHTGAGANLATATAFVAREFLASFAALAGGWTPGGVALMIGTAALLATAVLRWRTFDRRAIVILITLAGFLLLTAVGRSNVSAKFHVPPIPPKTDRYLWVNDVLLICLVVHCLRGRRIPAVAMLAAAGLTVVNGSILAPGLSHYRDVAIGTARVNRTFLVAVDALGERADPTRPLPLGFLPVPTSDYLGLVRHFGSPVANVRLDQLGPEQTRVQVDQWMVHDLQLHLRLGDMPPGSTCQVVTGAEQPAGAAVLPGETIVIKAADQPATVAVRRLAGAFDAPLLGAVDAGTTGVVSIPVDHSAWPWHVHVAGAGAQLSQCR